MSKERLTKTTYNPCDECNYAFHKYNQESGMCKLCEFKSYRDLEEQGLLLRLPCKRVWFICDKGSKYATVMSKSIYDLEVYQIKEIDVKGHYFSTEEKAEEKLRELEGK